jgi:hypothetical protein
MRNTACKLGSLSRFQTLSQLLQFDGARVFFECESQKFRSPSAGRVA